MVVVVEKSCHLAKEPLSQRVIQMTFLSLFITRITMIFFICFVAFIAGYFLRDKIDYMIFIIKDKVKRFFKR